MDDPNNLRGQVSRFISIEGEDAIVTDARMTAYILDHCEIFFQPENRFFCMTDLGGDNYPQYFAVLKPRFNKEFAPYETQRGY